MVVPKPLFVVVEEVEVVVRYHWRIVQVHPMSMKVAGTPVALAVVTGRGI